MTSSDFDSNAAKSGNVSITAISMNTVKTANANFDVITVNTTYTSINSYASNTVTYSSIISSITANDGNARHTSARSSG